MTIEIEHHKGFIPFTKIGYRITHNDVEYYNFVTVTGNVKGADLLKEVAIVLGLVSDLKLMIGADDEF